MFASNLYTQAVIDHYRAPRNFGALASHTHAADGANPLCGDTLRVELRCADGRVAEMRFSGEACAIAKAAASMLSELAIDRSDAELAGLERVFIALVAGNITSHDQLGGLNAMRELANHPVRQKCALLPFATLRAALAGLRCATTEGSK
ncbi:MAG TPA: SUF system NifU family Fe-S cluster assembly protein [Rhodanobacteraceae bacterium]|jgi:nitrogen fixation NifU-like protein|nr:SUF system NifU family Fe-S cluster assembly protein [Rhodanobacteraceae bacterium]